MTKHGPAQRIRPIAIAIVRNGDQILVQHGFDSRKNQSFYRPPGGGIDFGEPASESLAREFREELGAELCNVQLLRVVENIFLLEGKTGHEVVFVFEADFADSSFYQRSDLEILEADSRTQASWISVSELVAGTVPVYPECVLDFLTDDPA